MKSVLTLLFAALLLVSCREDGLSPRGVYVRFVNQTGSTIQNATVDAQPISNLADQATSAYVQFERFGTDSGLPDADFVGEIDGATHGSTNQGYWCGTEKENLRPGKYTVVVTLRQNDTDRFFHLEFKGNRR